MTTGGDAYLRTNPIFNRNKLKLGVFAFNGTAAVMTKLPEQYAVTWENCLDVALEADAAGFEALVPYARWRTSAGSQHRSGRVYENLTWTSAIAAKTNYTCVMTTIHVSLLHPLMLAKAASTIDHISNGRFALNIVCGWYKAETEMFGMTMMEHDERYDYAEEWLKMSSRCFGQTTNLLASRATISKSNERCHSLSPYSGQCRRS